MTTISAGGMENGRVSAGEGFHSQDAQNRENDPWRDTPDQQEPGGGGGDLKGFEGLLRDYWNVLCFKNSE